MNILIGLQGNMKMFCIDIEKNKFILGEIKQQIYLLLEIRKRDDFFEGKSVSNFVTQIDRGNDRICCFADNILNS